MCHPLISREKNTTIKLLDALTRLGPVLKAKSDDMKEYFMYWSCLATLDMAQNVIEPMGMKSIGTFPVKKSMFTDKCVQKLTFDFDWTTSAELRSNDLIKFTLNDDTFFGYVDKGADKFQLVLRAFGRRQIPRNSTIRLHKIDRLGSYQVEMEALASFAKLGQDYTPCHDVLMSNAVVPQQTVKLPPSLVPSHVNGSQVFWFVYTDFGYGRRTQELYCVDTGTARNRQDTYAWKADEVAGEKLWAWKCACGSTHKFCNR